MDAGNPTQLLTASGAQSTDGDTDTCPGTSALCSGLWVEEADPGLLLCSLEHFVTRLPKCGPAAWGSPAAFPVQAGNVARGGTSPPASSLGHFSFRCPVLGMEEERNLLFLVTLISCVFGFPLQPSSTAGLTHACPVCPGEACLSHHTVGQEPRAHGE